MHGYLDSAIKQFEYYRGLGEKAMAQVSDEGLRWEYVPLSNSVATIVKHMHGNMLSRWTDFLTSDGEKEWRRREAEFDNDLDSRDLILQRWNEGWAALFNALEGLSTTDLERIVYIRNEGHSVVEAINRQLCHYAYHVGQIVMLCKMQQGEEWRSLSIPRGGTAAYNAERFEKPKRRAHFTDGEG
jgi:hypothetical protein